MADQADSIFSNSQGTPATPPAQGTSGTPNQDDLVTLLGSIKNERGEPKYKSIPDALNALKHSQDYIPTLKQTNEEMERKLNDAIAKAARIEELERVVTELTNKSTPVVQDLPQGLTEAQVAELVNRTLTQTQQRQIQSQNVDLVTQSVKKAFGDKAEEVFYGKARELGMSIEQFNTLAATTPKAVLKLVGINPDGGDLIFSRPGPTFNTEGFQPKQDSLVGRNDKSALIGASMDDLKTESQKSAQMLAELAEAGLSINDLTNPKLYNKYFKAR